MTWIRNYYAVTFRRDDHPEVIKWFVEQDIGAVFRLANANSFTYEIDMTESQQILMKLKFAGIEFKDVKVYKKNPNDR